MSVSSSLWSVVKAPFEYVLIPVSRAALSALGYSLYYLIAGVSFIASSIVQFSSWAASGIASILPNALLNVFRFIGNSAYWLGASILSVAAWPFIQSGNLATSFYFSAYFTPVMLTLACAAVVAATVYYFYNRRPGGGGGGNPPDDDDIISPVPHIDVDDFDLDRNYGSRNRRQRRNRPYSRYNSSSYNSSRNNRYSYSNNRWNAPQWNPEPIPYPQPIRIDDEDDIDLFALDDEVLDLNDYIEEKEALEIPYQLQVQGLGLGADVVIPNNLKCPMSHEIMNIPVQLARSVDCYAQKKYLDYYSFARLLQEAKRAPENRHLDEEDIRIYIPHLNRSITKNDLIPYATRAQEIEYFIRENTPAPPTFASRFEAANIELPGGHKFLCPILMDVINEAVKVKTNINGIEHVHYFDKASLKGYFRSQLGEDYRDWGYIDHPINRQHIRWSDVEDAPELAEEMEAYLREHAPQSNQEASAEDPNSSAPAQQAEQTQENLDVEQQQEPSEEEHHSEGSGSEMDRSSSSSSASSEDDMDLDNEQVELDTIGWR